MVILKQFYIDQDQERLLKQRSQELGVSEAELLRQALDALLHDEAPCQTVSAERLAALDDLLTDMEEHPFRVRPWTRDELYEERIGRFINR